MSNSIEPAMSSKIMDNWLVDFVFNVLNFTFKIKFND